MFEVFIKAVFPPSSFYSIQEVYCIQFTEKKREILIEKIAEEALVFFTRHMNGDPNAIKLSNCVFFILLPSLVI